LIEQQVEVRAEAIALEYEEEQVSYGEMNVRANRLAHHLMRLGVGPEVRVGICLERSIEMVVSILAVLKAGGVYLPMDPSYPQQRLSYMVEEGGVEVLVSEEREGERLPENAPAVVYVDRDGEEIERGSEENPERRVEGDNLAYVIYTSGSTGAPKGAMNTQAGICNRIVWMQRAYELREEDVVLQKTPLSFDVSVWELIWPLMSGARMVVSRREGHKDSRYLAEVMKERGVSVVHFVPAMLGAVMEEEEIKGCESVRLVISSGEALSGEMVKRCYERMRGELENLYGPTEAAVDVTRYSCERGEEGAPPIGRPIANTEIYILDEEERPVPVGVKGELYIGGEGVARGYVNRAELTAERFLPNPYGREGGERIYRTGDVARYLSDGNIEYLGRIDHQVKIRGYRIELGEIEAALVRHREVRQAVVVAREEGAGGKRLVGYIVREEGSEAGVSELRSHLKEGLPEYMVPAALVFLEEMPLTANGKIRSGEMLKRAIMQARKRR
jgi:amino acid adenylation domain-containing protein